MPPPNNNNNTTPPNSSTPPSHTHLRRPPNLALPPCRHYFLFAQHLSQLQATHSTPATLHHQAHLHASRHPFSDKRIHPGPSTTITLLEGTPLRPTITLSSAENCTPTVGLKTWWTLVGGQDGEGEGGVDGTEIPDTPTQGVPACLLVFIPAPRYQARTGGRSRSGAPTSCDITASGCSSISTFASMVSGGSEGRQSAEGEEGEEGEKGAEIIEDEGSKDAKKDGSGKQV